MEGTRGARNAKNHTPEVRLLAVTREPFRDPEPHGQVIISIVDSNCYDDGVSDARRILPRLSVPNCPSRFDLTTTSRDSLVDVEE